MFELYYVYAANSKSLGSVKAENSKSFDFGIEKKFPDFGLNFEANFFNIEYEDVLEGWEDGTSSGLAYTTQNMPGKVKSKGLEFSSNWKKNNFLNLSVICVSVLVRIQHVVTKIKNSILLIFTAFGASYIV